MSSTMVAPTITAPISVSIKPLSSKDGTITAMDDEMNMVAIIMAVNGSKPKKLAIAQPTIAGTIPFKAAKVITLRDTRPKISVLISIPAINIKKTAPMVPKKRIVGVNLNISRPKGPKRIPANISATTYGSRILSKVSDKKSPIANIIKKIMNSFCTNCNRFTKSFSTILYQIKCISYPIE